MSKTGIPYADLTAFERYMLEEAHRAGLHDVPGSWPSCIDCSKQAAGRRSGAPLPGELGRKELPR